EVSVTRNIEDTSELHAAMENIVPATLENDVLTWEVRNATAGKELLKVCSLKLDADGRHALFSYKVTQEISTQKAISREFIEGSGRLSRAR
ncbi:MAG: hypothetical protein V4710_14850, partial [Verrucomicrobiota bacterium]